MPGFFKGVKDNRATDAGRGAEVDVWAVDDLIGRGYALATFYCGDVAPDIKGKGLDMGVFPHYRKPGQAKPGPHDWGAIAAWAWGLSRAVDYLVTDEDIDGGRIAVVGWSRLGKAAIVAAAFDERIALVIPHQAGCGGTAPSRAKVGESVRQINTGNPHWFAAEFKNFNDQPEKLPFDQNCLVALVAPRSVLLTNAVQDTGANPEGQFQVLRSADPVYRMLGAGGLDARSMPEVNALVGSTLGYHIRPGHTRDGPRGLGGFPQVRGHPVRPVANPLMVGWRRTHLPPVRPESLSDLGDDLALRCSSGGALLVASQWVRWRFHRPGVCHGEVMLAGVPSAIRPRTPTPSAESGIRGRSDVEIPLESQ